MLPKKNRVDTRTVEKIFKNGRSLNAAALTFKFLRNDSPHTQISFIAPKNVAKSAVTRNYLRRLGYRELGKLLKGFPTGLVAVFVFKKNVDDATIIAHDIKEILSKIN